MRAIVKGELRNAIYEILPGFNLAVPTQVTDIESKLLNPRNCWLNETEHDKNAALLIEKFIDNFKKFSVSADIKNAGPQLNLL